MQLCSDKVTIQESYYYHYYSLSDIEDGSRSLSGWLAVGSECTVHSLLMQRACCGGAVRFCE